MTARMEKLPVASELRSQVIDRPHRFTAPWRGMPLQHLAELAGGFDQLAVFGGEMGQGI